MKNLTILLFFLAFPVALLAQGANYFFRLEIDGIQVGAFEEISGLQAEVEVIEFEDGTSSFLRKRPGRTTFGNIKLKRGYIAGDDIKDWFEFVREGNIDRRSAAITVLDRDREPIEVINLESCWPRQWKIEPFQSAGNEVLTEEIVFVTERIRFSSPR